VVKTVTHEDVTSEELGGARVHSESGRRALHGARRRRVPRCRCASCCPTCRSTTPRIRRSPTDDDPTAWTSARHDRAAVERPALRHAAGREAVVDDGKFFEVHRRFAKNIIVGFARLGGRVVGIVGNQPNHLAGVLDIKASLKGARFIRFCDAFNIPLVTFEDVPGFLPGKDQEWGGIITHGAKLLYAYCEATVPKITVITRKAYGGAYDVMNSKHIRADLNLAWPSAEIAVMGAEGAAKIVFRREIQAAKDPKKAEEKRLVADYKAKFANPYQAAARGYVDDVIEPRARARC
jgi:propionyl-CoA carboxylase beta chain